MNVREAPEEVRQAYPGHLHAIPKRIYRFRTLGMGLSFLAIATVLIELDAAWPAWTWATFCCLLWPHVAYQLARRNGDPFGAELRNLMIDSALAGSLVPVMHFNLLPSVVLVTVASADKINIGVRGLLLRSLPGVLIGALIMGLLTGFSMHMATSTPVLLATLPIMVIHTLAVSVSSHRLIRRVQSQNRRLDEISRIDSLTGLEMRGHWRANAGQLLEKHVAGITDATLLLVDVDLFKQINDRNGHTIGDDVLQAIATVIKNALPPCSHAGRIGGDEFAIAMPMDEDSARKVAAIILAGVEALEFSFVPPLRCSVSIGIAGPVLDDASLRAWLEAADHALYRAKAAGRNRIASRDVNDLRLRENA
ncbi:diguanylate cyclase [Thermomonas sp.]